jgi:hypothetical protein
MHLQSHPVNGQGNSPLVPLTRDEMNALREPFRLERMPAEQSPAPPSADMAQFPHDVDEPAIAVTARG